MLKYIDQLIASGLNDNVLVVETEADIPDRFQAIVEAMKVGLQNGQIQTILSEYRSFYSD